MTVDPCPNCGAAMAADQRYCLSCGLRRAEARLDFVEILRGRPGEPLAAGSAIMAGAPAAVAVAARSRVNTAVVASIGCLLLALGVGVIIGHGNSANRAAAPVAAPAQVIKVQGGGAADTAAAPSRAKSGKVSAGKTPKTSGSKVPTAASASQSHATNPALKQLSHSSGKDYSKQSAKLPKTVSTGGKAPPIDKSKPAAGGGGFDTIG